ncbi:MAG: LysR substrate-binding domain-containing protein [Gemmatimonadota bacterium]
MVPDLRRLRYFIAVAEELHFGRAARRLNIAQPPLSQQIAGLEQSLGVRLFSRSTRSVALTPAGTVLLQGARRALREAERAEESARRAGRGEFDTLRVGFTDASALSVLPNAVRRFRERLPHVHLELMEDDGTAGQVDALQRDLVDIALVRGPLERGGLTIDVILEERFVLAMPDTHPLASRTRVPLRLVRNEPLVHFPRRLSPAYYDMLISMCQTAGFTPNVAYEVVKYQTVLALVAAGVGVCFVPRSNCSITRPGVTYRELTGANGSAQVVAAYHGDRASVVRDVFLALVREARAREGRARRPLP